MLSSQRGYVKVYCPALKKLVEIPRNPVRIASIAPSITETLIEMGLDRAIVGISTWCKTLKHYGYEEVSDKAIISDYSSVDIDALRRYGIDLVLLQDGYQKSIAGTLQDHDIPFYVIRLPTGLDIVEIPIEIGSVVNAVNRGVALSRCVMKYLSMIYNIVTGITVLAVLDLGGITLPGNFSFITRILQHMGFEVVNKEILSHYVWGPEAVDIANELVKESDVIVLEISDIKVSIEKALEVLSPLRNAIHSKKLTIVVLPVLGLSDFGPQIVWRMRVLAQAILKAVVGKRHVMLRTNDMYRKPISSIGYP